MTARPSPQGWYVDPSFPGAARYWDGTRWTDSVLQGGITFDAPLEPSQATLPPVPGTQVRSPMPASSRRAPVDYALPDTGSNSRSTIGVLFGAAVVFFFVLLTFAIISDNTSSDQAPSSTDVPPATDAPPPTEAPAAGG